MNLLEKINWFLSDFNSGSLNNYTNDDWINLETEIINMIDNCSDGSMLQECLSLDVNYLIPYDVRLYFHKRLTEIEPKNEKAIRDYAFYLRAFGDPPDELKALEMLKRFEENK